jgi:hypothetical protein
VLLRAPRRFSHPAWLPRQNVCTSLDNVLREFLVDSGLGGDAAAASKGGDDKPPRRRGAGGVKTEGVLVGCCRRQADPDGRGTSRPTVAEVGEENELIWWAWDGKLTGFAEW